MGEEEGGVGEDEGEVDGGAVEEVVEEVCGLTKGFEQT